ncbi:uncharacterized protein LOC143881059 [Tasmannia lanceolata]|uniref:uncharacterized protein LOC143881059 n=1 Tax=Tasmannia lanceolata TaxID=3420 RepID=UPI004062EEC4
MAGEISSTRKSFTWSPDMDHYLCEALVRQVQLGKKGDNGTFRPEVWNSVVQELNNSCERNDIKVDHCKNRLKTLRKHYVVAKDMLRLSGFSWDSVRKMLTADRHVWDEYLKVHPDAKFYRKNSVPNFEELCTIIGNDHSEGRRARTSVGARMVNNVQGLLLDTNDKTMNGHNDELGDEDDMGGTGSSSMGYGSSYGQRRSRSATQDPSTRPKKKKKTANVLMFETLVALTAAIKDLSSNKESIVKRVVDEVLKIPDVDSSFYERARKFLMADDNTPLWFLNLPDDGRSTWLKDALGI